MNKTIPVSIIIPMRNSATTVLETLTTLGQQTYPIKEIIVVDNVSTDNSVKIVEQFAKKSKINVQIIKKEKNNGVGASYNQGVRKARASLVVFMHSDSSLPTKYELEKLVAAHITDPDVVSTYSYIILPKKVWLTYNFWQKCLLVRSVDKELPGMNSKFDCHKKEIYQKIGGFDEVNFGENIGVGSQDADLHMRLRNIGKVIKSEARVKHLHYMGSNYSLSDWIANRKLLAKSYGRLMRIRMKELHWGEAIFLVKPLLAILPFLPGFHIIGVLLLIIYSFANMPLMYTTPQTLRDGKIILLPFLNIFLLYYEVYYMFEAFFVVEKNPDIVKIIK